MKYKQIEDFFNTYIEWANENLLNNSPTDEQNSDDEASALMEYAYRIEPGGVDREGLKLLQRFGLKIPDYYEAFLSYYSYRSLEIPLMKFPSTKKEDDLEELVGMFERCSVYGLIPFAHDKDGAGTYCIDLLNSECIIYFPYSPGTLSQRDPLIKSFLDVMILLKEVFEYGGEINSLPEDEKEDALHNIRSLEPEILGSKAWDDWWLMQLVGVQL